MGGHHSWFDPCSRIDSPIHRIPAGRKLLGVTAIVFTLIVSSDHGLAPLVMYTVLFFLLLAMTIASALPMGYIIKRVLFLEPVVLGAALLALFQPDGRHLFFFLVLRSTFCLWTMTIFAGTTPFDELLAVMRQVHLPAILITTVAMMYRYLFVLIDQSQRMRRARASRTFDRRTMSIWRNLAGVIGQLFIRTADRSERVYAAMLARGWK
jgi:cobalt/nickel transport system permease protein